MEWILWIVGKSSVCIWIKHDMKRVERVSKREKHFETLLEDGSTVEAKV